MVSLTMCNAGVSGSSTNKSGGLLDNFADLFTARAAWGELVLVALHTVVFILVGDEGLRADRLFAAVTDEAALVPCRARVLQFPRT